MKKRRKAFFLLRATPAMSSNLSPTLVVTPHWWKGAQGWGGAPRRPARGCPWDALGLANND